MDIISPYAAVMFAHFIGVDVSKDKLDTSYQLHAQWYDQQISNCPRAISDWLAHFETSSIQLLLEPTGTYSRRLQEILEQRQIAYTLVNPRKSRAFAAALGQVNKNDKQDARLLALMGKNLALPPSKVQSKYMKERQQLRMALNALLKQRQQLANQLHALEQHMDVVPLASQALEQTLQTVEHHIEQLRRQLKQTTDEEEERIKKLMLSVIGVGDTTADLLLELTNGFKDFESDKQLVKFVGVAPSQHQSGSSIKLKGRIAKTGPAQLRATLYMAARSAKKHNPACKELFERLRAKGKPYKVAMIAVINKLLRQTFAVVKSGVPFDKNFGLIAKK